MTLIRRRKRTLPVVPLASMSDIAFLLLIFLIVAATIDIDTGISLSLPEYKPEESPAQVEKSRVIEINIVKDSVFLNGEPVSSNGLYTSILDRVRESREIPDDSKPVSLIRYSDETLYQKYIVVLDNVKRAYKNVQDETAKEKFGKSFKNLSEEEKNTITKIVPVYITVAELKKK